jgi:hypothetical protein
MLVLEATVIPAATQTFLVEAYEEDGRIKTLRHPIVGWSVDPHKTKAVPILLVDVKELFEDANFAIIFENGEVYDSDPENGGLYDSLDDWVRDYVEPRKLPQRPLGETLAKKREAESQTTRESATPSKTRAASPILMTPEQERETDADMAKLEAQARETMARLHKDGVIQGAPQGEPEKPKRKPRRTKHVPSDAADLI